jgi:hypothetical protein
MIFGGGEYTIVRKGNVHISFGGKMLIFHNVYYMPGMELNLFFSKSEYAAQPPTRCQL